MLFTRRVAFDGERPVGAVPVDEVCERLVVVRLRSARRLSEGQRRVIEEDYQAMEGEARLEVRAALLWLPLRRMRLDREDGLVEVANREELVDILEGLKARFAHSMRWGPVHALAPRSLAAGDAGIPRQAVLILGRAEPGRASGASGDVNEGNVREEALIGHRRHRDDRCVAGPGADWTRPAGWLGSPAAGYSGEPAR